MSIIYKAYDYIKNNKYKCLIVASISAIILLTLVRTIHDTVNPLMVNAELHFLKPMTVILFAVLLIGFLCLYFGISKWKAEKVFLCLGIFFGIIYSLLLPPFTSPDEAVHVDTVYNYSSKLLGEQTVDENGAVLYREDDSLYEHNDQHLPNARSYSLMFHNFGNMDHSEGVVSMSRAPQNVSALAYIPQIIGVTLARLFNLGNIQMLLWGRWFALAFFIVLVYWAIKLAPIGKELLMVVALLPMTLQQVCSMSYDSNVLTLAFLYFGILMYLIFDANEVTWKHILILFVLFALIAPGKIVYLVLALMLFMIPASKFKNKLHKILGMFLSLSGGAAIILLTRFQTVVSVGSGSSSMLTEQATYSLGYLLHNPYQIVEVVYGTIISQGTYYIETMLGQYLGWLEIMVPGYIIYGFVVLIVLSVIKNEEEDKVLSPFQRFWAVGVIGVITCMIFYALLIDWTPLGQYYVAGVQGRYFLPMLPFLVILLKNNFIVMKQNVTKYIYAGLYILQYLSIYHVYVTIISR
ncbi:MAG: DUF2142 domain-containing protein [Lachnospiraceae bacterium]|nr:DUF2142 domain-containing protein [Lachnospiraceae bacterium]